MFGIGFPELILILVVALIAIGPDKLPGIARALGKAFVEFRRATEDLKKTITDADYARPDNGKREKEPDNASPAPAKAEPPAGPAEGQTAVTKADEKATPS